MQTFVFGFLQSLKFHFRENFFSFPLLTQISNQPFSVIQAQRSAHRDGRAPNRLRPQRAISLVHPRGRVRIAERARRVSAPPGPGRRALQLVLPVEGHRRVHQHVLLVSRLRDATRRSAVEALQRRERMVARRRYLHDEFVARARLSSRRKSQGHLRASVASQGLFP